MSRTLTGENLSIPTIFGLAQGLLLVTPNCCSSQAVNLSKLNSMEINRLIEICLMVKTTSTTNLPLIMLTRRGHLGEGY
jgi:hypothetical protein